MSETKMELAKALVKAQSQMEAALKDKTNPHFKNRYADLTSVWEACRKPLTDNGLAIVQKVSTPAPNAVTVETVLLHVSGESESSSLTLPVAQAGNPQAMGSAITYGRRYGLAAMVGVVADEDDDGNAAAKHAPAHQDDLKAKLAAQVAAQQALKQAHADAEARAATQAQKSSEGSQLPPASDSDAYGDSLLSQEPPPDVELPTPSRGRATGSAVFPNYGRAKGMPVHGAEEKDLRFYHQRAQASLADPSKARWHDKERALLNAIESELASRGLK